MGSARGRGRGLKRWRRGEALVLAVRDEQSDHAQDGVPSNPARNDKRVAGRTGSGPRDHHRHVEGNQSGQGYRFVLGAGSSLST